MLAAVIVGAALLTLGSQDASAHDLYAGLADAEQKVAEADAEVPELQSRAAAAEARYRVAIRQAAPPLGQLRRDKAAVRHLRRQLADREQAARARIARLNHQHQQEVDDHDEKVRSGVGFGLAALVGGLIAIGWGWFRATAAVAALTEIDLKQAIGICVGGGLLMVIVGLVLGSADGAVGALGSFLFCLGLILPSAFLLARHSAEVQRRRSKPLLRRERLPSWLGIAVAGLMLVLFFAGTGSALFAEGASSEPISSQLEERAEALSNGDGAHELAAALTAAARAEQDVSAPVNRRNGAHRELEKARRELGRAVDRLASAKASEHSFGRQLVALEEQDRRQREKEEAEQQEEEEKRITEEEMAAETQAAPACNDPNYRPCLPLASDYDCPGGSGNGPDYAPGPVEVIGADIYGLDSDGDGIGCEEE